MENIDRILGMAPGTRLARHVPTLTRHIEARPDARAALCNWLTAQGLPSYTALMKAKAESLAKAYIFPAYLTSWRANASKRYGDRTTYASALDEHDADADADALGDAETETPSPAIVPSPADTKALLDRILPTLHAVLQNHDAKITSKLTAEATRITEGLAARNADAIAKALAEAVPSLVAKALADLLPPRKIQVQVADRPPVCLGLQHESFPLLLRACSARDHKGHRLNIWLSGPTGGGKTSAAEAVAKALNLPFGSDGSLDADYKVLGFRNAQGEIISTQFLDIFANGGIYVADEIDNWLPSALVALNAALSNGFVASPGGLLRRHPNACIIACANTWGLGATNDYVGRNKLDAASLDRFWPKISWPIDEKLERAVAEAQAGTLGHAWHDTIRAARACAARQGLKLIVSPRMTFSGIALLQAGFAASEVMEMTYLAGLSPEQRRAFAGVAFVAPPPPQAALAPATVLEDAL